MKLKEAAIKVLIENGNQEMSSKDLWSKIDDRNLVKLKGDTPWASLNTILLYHSDNVREELATKKEYRKKEKLFHIVGENPMKFKISDLREVESEVVSSYQSDDSLSMVKMVTYIVGKK